MVGIGAGGIVQNQFDFTSPSSQMTNPTSTTSVANPWAQYFGEVAGWPQQGASAALSRRNEDLPWAYRGENVYVGEVLEGLIAIDNGWPTTVCLPMEFNEKNTWTWNLFKFDQHIVDMVPHEGVSRVLRHSETTMSAVSNRRGLAVFFEHDFARTEKGRTVYIRSLMQLRLCVQMTNSFDVLNTIVNCHNNDALWQEIYGTSELDPITKIENEIKQFGIVQKQDGGKGVNLMDSELREMADRLGFEPNMYIVPVKFRRWVQMVPTKKTEYIWAGPAGPKRLLEGPAGLGRIGDINVYVAPTFDVMNNGVHVSLLSRNTLTGEYMTMFDEYRGADYTSDARDIVVYSEDADREIKLKLFDAIRNSHQFELDEASPERGNLLPRPAGVTEDMFRRPNGDKVVYFGQMRPKYLPNTTVKRVALSMAKARARNVPFPSGIPNATEVQQAFDLSNQADTGEKERSKASLVETDPILKEVAAAFLAMPITLDTIQWMIENDVVVPLGVILARPFQGHKMGSVVLMRGGTETGKTYWGHANFMLGQDVKVKTIYGNFTYYEKAVITDPKKIIIAANVFYEGYLGGGGVEYFTTEQIETMKQTDYKFEETDLVRGRASLIALLVPYADNDAHLDRYIDITGHFYEDGNHQDENTAHYPTYQYYLYQLGFDRMLPSERGSMHQKRIPETNTILCRGFQKNYSGGQEWTRVIINQGHHGRNVYAGCGEVRRGMMQEYRQETYIQTVY